MRLARNRLTTIGYQLYRGTSPVVDADGYETGEHEVIYSPIKELVCTVTSRSNTNVTVNGNTFPEPFGTLISYDKLVLTTDLECGIDEHSQLYIYRKDKPDYRVVAKDSCYSHIALACAKIE